MQEVRSEGEGRIVMKKTCEYCGAKMVEYKHGLSKGLMRVLYRVILLCGGVVNEFEIKDVALSYNQRCNFQKLRYWGLIKKIGDFDGKGGTWALTSKGLSFACGELFLPKFARTYRGELVAQEGESIKVEDITGGWKFRPEYADDAIPHKPKGG